MSRAEVIKSRENVALYRDGEALYITVSIPAYQSTSGLLAGRIYYLLHKKIKEEKLALKLELYELEFGRRPVRLLYRVSKAEEAEQLFGRVLEFFYECLLEIFSEPEKLIEIELKNMELIIRAEERERRK